MVEQLKNKKDDSDLNSDEFNKNKLEDVKNYFKKLTDIMSDEMRKRFISSLILIPIAIFIIYSPQLIFAIAILSLAILMAFEWITIVKTEEETNMWRILGLIYILLPSFSLMYIKSTENGSDIILWLFLIVWATDIAGLFVGKTIGGPKLSPTISPKKTWSGLIGGVLASMFVGLLSSVIFKETALFFIVLAGLLGVMEQIGDLIESKFKRTFNVKDSGNIIPGHGGIMDRFDGLTLVAPIVALLVMISNNIF